MDFACKWFQINLIFERKHYSIGKHEWQRRTYTIYSVKNIAFSLCLDAGDLQECFYGKQSTVPPAVQYTTFLLALGFSICSSNCYGDMFTNFIPFSFN